MTKYGSKCRSQEGAKEMWVEVLLAQHAIWVF